MAQVNFDACMAALDHIQAAPKDNVPVDHLCFRPDYGQRDFVDQLELTVDRGILGERWVDRPWLRLPDGRPDPSIQVSILSKRVMDLVWTDRDAMIHPGDPVVADLDTSEANLPVGTRLQAGSAVIEVSDVFNNGCVKWNRVYGNDSLRWLNLTDHRALRLRDILCRIVQDGILRVGDRLSKL